MTHKPTLAQRNMAYHMAGFPRSDARRRMLILSIGLFLCAALTLIGVALRMIP